jgi:predicted permease
VRFEHWFYTLPLRIRSIVRRRQVDRDLDDEIQYHLEVQVEERVAAGMDRDEARRVVLRGFGEVVRAKEQCRDARGVNAIDSAGKDLRYAARVLRRSPAFTVVAVLTLALGIGANTAVFSLVDGILLARLPYTAPQELVSITGTYPNGGLAAMREEVRTMDVGAYAEGHWFTLKGDGEPMRAAGTRVSAELFSILGVEPALGRWLRPGEDLAPRDHYVILSHQLWTTRFKRDDTIVGRFIDLDGIRREVLAVMPASFQFPSTRTQLWVPLGLDPGNAVSYWAGDFMPVVGRLRAGATIPEANADIRLFQSRIFDRFPWRMPRDWNQNVGVVPLQEAVVGGVRTRLLILISAVALILVSACANVANLSVSRAIARRREIGIRTALGAAPSRIARQLLTESVLLASLGGVVGLLFATQALAVLKVALPADTPRLAEVQLNWRVLLFTGGLSVLTGCAFGLAPVLHSLRLRLRTVLDSADRGGGRRVAAPLRAALTIAQIACAVLLVITAGLLVRSLWTLSRQDLGFRPDQVLTARISPTETQCATPERCLAFYRAFDAQVQAVPGIRGAALVNTLPLTGAVAKRSLNVEGFTPSPSQTTPLFWLYVITPDYFRVMGIRVLSGRPFAREDLTGAPVAIVTAATARRLWPEQDPIGRHFQFAGTQPWHTVVGVVADVRAYDLTRSVPEWIGGIAYVPQTPNATMEDGRIPTEMTLTLRTTIESGRVAAMLPKLAAGAGGEVVIGDVRPMREIVEEAAAVPAATTSLLVTMAGLALVLGCIGVYGVLSFLVSTQIRDLGIRFALGAQRRDVFWLMIKEGATLCVAGIAVGGACAVGVTRWLSSELYGVSPTDPMTYLAVAVVMSLVTLMACYLPTRRAMSVDPLIVLRDQ